MTGGIVRVGVNWLALREPADAAARAEDLVEHLRRQPPPTDAWLIHDLGSGTGAMGRWLAPRLPGAQHWVVHDLDPDLLALAVAHPPGSARDGAPVTLEAKHSDVTRLKPGDLAGASLITASALLDVLTEEELMRLIAAGAATDAPMLLTLSVVGHVELSPADLLDRRVARAFNAHQRRVTDRGRLLGPDAVSVAVEQLRRVGRQVLVRPSPWRLDASRPELAAQWFSGWLGAACEQEPELEAEAKLYGPRRLAQAAAGELAVVVGHADLLASPG